jgi:C4-dicarboxylate transporter/malic acid transport protein
MANHLNPGIIIKHFSPAWFASIMGTGGVANVLFQLSGSIPFLQPLAVGLFWLNIVLFVILIFPWIGRWFIHFGSLRQDLEHPVMSNFFVTMPVGGIILGTNFFLIGKDYFSMAFIVGLSLVFWVVGVVMALVLGVFVMYHLFSMETVSAEMTNFSWFISPVASIVIPLLGNPLIGFYNASNVELDRIINLIDIIFYGIGMLLFIMLSSILLNRFIANKMSPSAALPTFWIMLGPVGVGTISLIGMADSSKVLGLLASTDSLKMLALMLWGFGLWAFLLIMIITVKYLSRGGIPFTLSWWAFIFPTAAYTLSSFSIYSYIKVDLVYWYTLVLALLLLFLWTITFIRTLVGTINGKLLVPPKN